ncbi:MAG: fibronectin type III domain-containing protein, partial [Bacteroidia bacterium]|nr:fibronectin type III domain-containing protein [Bacteroidia bacterium]
MKHNNSLRSAFLIQALVLFLVTTSFGQSNSMTGSSNGSIKPTSTSTSNVSRIDSSSNENFVSTAAMLRASGSCSSPSGVLSTVLSSTSVRLSWTAKTGIMYYNFRYRRTGTSAWTYDSTITNSKTIYGLIPSTSYDYQIQTRCNSSTLSVYGTRYTFSTTAGTVNCGTPNVALFGTINKTASSATVYWTAVSGALSYNVRYRVNGSSGAWTTVTTSSVNANLAGLTASTQYEFQVQSVCSTGSSAYSSSGIFSTNASCGIPDIAWFSSTAITSSSATLGWNAVAGATGYNIQYRVNGSGSSWIAANSTTTSKNVTGLSSATTYEFQVQTICAGGNSAFSASGIFTTTIAITCGVPDVNMFTATDKTASSCTVGWAAVSGATGYNVQYRVRNSGSAWNTVNVSSTSANLTSLAALTQYEFQVQAICSGGVGAYSASGIFTTISATTTCGIPTGLNVTGITTSAATLGWTSASGATSYNVQYRKSGTTSWTNTTSTTASKTVSGLLATSAYEFQVQTVCSGGTSSFSSSTIFTTLTSGVVSLPMPDHIVVVMFENHAYHQIIGNSAAPRINAFAAEANTTLFTESYGIEHPSQPNYLDIFAGGNQGVTNNVKPSSKFTSMNLAAALQQAGLTFISYSDGMPSAGYDGDVSGTYARKHNAIANWVGTGTNQVSSSLNQPFTSFPTDYSTLPTVSFVNPDMNHSMHDGSGNTAITNGDNWFYSKIYPYAQWA